MTLHRGEAAAASASRELRGVVERVVERRLGLPATELRIEHRASRYRTSFALDEIDVRLPDGTLLRMVRKDVGPRALAEGARRAKPAFLYHPLREIDVYRRLLPDGVPGTAELFGAEVDPERQRYWLFLERVAGVELYQVGELEWWKEAARWLARLHARFAADAGARARLEGIGLVRHDARYLRRWAVRAVEFARPGTLRLIHRIARRHARAVPRLLALPPTLLHGEMYASNVLVAPRPDGSLRVCAVDWEMAGLGPGLVDLAALVAGKWSEAARQEIALAYHASLREAGGASLSSPEEFLEALALCRFHLAVQWLGWSRDWTPPAEHAHDWLAEAAALSDILHLEG